VDYASYNKRRDLFTLLDNAKRIINTKSHVLVVVVLDTLIFIRNLPILYFIFVLDNLRLKFLTGFLFVFLLFFFNF